MNAWSNAKDALMQPVLSFAIPGVALLVTLLIAGVADRFLRVLCSCASFDRK